MRRGSLVILMYHSIDESGSVISVSPATFRHHMASLARDGFRVLALSTVAEHLRRGEAFPERSIAVTFDDGFVNTYTTGFPVLQKYGFSATVFLVTGHVGRVNDWPSQPRQIPRLPLLSWPQIEEMGRHGICFGAHSVSHPLLPAIPRREAEREIGESREAIEAYLQRPVEFFAYPYGRHDGGIRDVVASLFQGACSTRPGQVHARSDPWALGRLDVCYVARAPLFKLLSTPLLPSYLGLLRLLRSAREGLRLGTTDPRSTGY
ncbi:MAG: polysaccharide deacetylase family protein [Candidatus Rokubacteria bacterium]|nr:polysaccharide deacetylase family protein [Candidatus Rokubacteria bacterium]